MSETLNIISDPIHILDVSVFTLMLILAVLSKRIGEAMKVPPFYHYYYTCSVLLIMLVVLDILMSEVLAVTIALRTGLVFSTLPVTLIYWRWLFVENIKKASGSRAATGSRAGVTSEAR